MNQYYREGLSASSILGIGLLILFILNPKAVLSSIGALIGFVAVFILCIAIILGISIYRTKRNLERTIRDAQSQQSYQQPHVQDWLDDSIDEQ